MTLDFNIREHIKIKRITKGVKSTNNYEGRLLAIKAIDDFQKRKGFDWLTLTSKAGYQSEIGNYSDAIGNIETCYKLKPFDPRSSYNLSTSYRTISRAYYSRDHPRIRMANKIYWENFGYIVNPENCKKAINNLGIDLDTVIYRFFECSFKAYELLEKKNKVSEYLMVKSNIEAMRMEFPEYLSIDKKRLNYLASLDTLANIEIIVPPNPALKPEEQYYAHNEENIKKEVEEAKRKIEMIKKAEYSMARYVVETFSPEKLESCIMGLKARNSKVDDDIGFLLDEILSIKAGAKPRGDNSYKEHIEEELLKTLAEGFVGTYTSSQLEKHIKGFEKDGDKIDLINAIREAEPRREEIIALLNKSKDT